MPIMEGTARLKRWKGSYDFAVDGGVAGTITLRSNDGPIPTGSVIEMGYVEVTTPPDSAAHTATIAVQAEAANDIVNAAVVSGAPWSTTGRKSIIPVATGATTVKTTAARNPAIVLAVQNLTAGKFDVYLQYL